MKYIKKEYIKNISELSDDKYYILKDYSIDYNNYIEIIEKYFPPACFDKFEDLDELCWFELCTYSYSNILIYSDETTECDYIIMD